jgi:hypothetical protein
LNVQLLLPVWREQSVMEEEKQTVVKGENERRITLLRFIFQTLTDINLLLYYM